MPDRKVRPACDFCPKYRGRRRKPKDEMRVTLSLFCRHNWPGFGNEVRRWFEKPRDVFGLASSDRQPRFGSLETDVSGEWLVEFSKFGRRLTQFDGALNCLAHRLQIIWVPECRKAADVGLPAMEFHNRRTDPDGRLYV